MTSYRPLVLPSSGKPHVLRATDALDVVTIKAGGGESLVLDAEGTYVLLAPSKILSIDAGIEFTKEQSHTIKVAASTTTDTDGGDLLLEGADAGPGNASGGALLLRGGDLSGTGTYGAVSIGASQTSVVNLGGSSTSVNVIGNVTFDGDFQHSLIVSAPSSAGNGNNLQIFAGLANTTGNGGALRLSAGGAVSAPGETKMGGNGYFYGGTGSETVTDQGGTGGTLYIYGGPGGDATGAGASGPGGDVRVQGGPPGTTVGGFEAQAGSLYLYGGFADAGDAGDVVIAGGLSTSGAPGAVSIGGDHTSGVSIGATTIPVLLNGPVTMSNFAGDFVFTKEATHFIKIADSTTLDTDGGDLLVQGGAATNGIANGGGLILRGGAGVGGGTYGSVTIGGSNTLQVYVGTTSVPLVVADELQFDGNVDHVLRVASSSTAGDGHSLYVYAGSANTSSNGGSLRLWGGDGTDGGGGQVWVQGGASVDNDAGDVLIAGGVSTNAGHGNVIIGSIHTRGVTLGSATALTTVVGDLKAKTDVLFEAEANHAVYVDASTTSEFVGGRLELHAGAAGPTVVGTGGTGGQAIFQAGSGGASTGAGTGGIGGASTVRAGTGGLNSSTGDGGAGGAMSVLGGLGGSAATSGTSGAGGIVNVIGGAGGAGNAGPAGSGGLTRIYGGAAGADGGGGGADGGHVVIEGGAGSGAGVNGSVLIGSSNSADVQLGAVSVPTVIHGQLKPDLNILFAADSNHTIYPDVSATPDAPGSTLTMVAGSGAAPDGNGGLLRLRAGSGQGTGVAGLVLIGDSATSEVQIGASATPTSIIGDLQLSTRLLFASGTPPTYGIVGVDVSAGGTIVLDSSVYNASFLYVYGTLPSATTLIVPTTLGATWFVKSGTTGNYTLTVKTAGGTGVTLYPGRTTHLLCEGSNIIELDPAYDHLKRRLLPMTRQYMGVAGKQSTDNTTWTTVGQIHFDPTQDCPSIPGATRSVTFFASTFATVSGITASVRLVNKATTSVITSSTMTSTVAAEADIEDLSAALTIGTDPNLANSNSFYKVQIKMNGGGPGDYVELHSAFLEMNWS